MAHRRHSGAQLRTHLQPRRWMIDSTFVDERGRNLSDHFAVSADGAWREVGATERLPTSSLGKRPLRVQ